MPALAVVQPRAHDLQGDRFQRAWRRDAQPFIHRGKGPRKVAQVLQTARLAQGDLGLRGCVVQLRRQRLELGQVLLLTNPVRLNVEDPLAS